MIYVCQNCKSIYNIDCETEYFNCKTCNYVLLEDEEFNDIFHMRSMINLEHMATGTIDYCMRSLKMKLFL